MDDCTYLAEFRQIHPKKGLWEWSRESLSLWRLFLRPFCDEHTYWLMASRHVLPCPALCPPKRWHISLLFFLSPPSVLSVSQPPSLTWVLISLCFSRFPHSCCPWEGLFPQPCLQLYSLLLSLPSADNFVACLLIFFHRAIYEYGTSLTLIKSIKSIDTRCLLVTCFKWWTVFLTLKLFPLCWL